MEAYLCAIKVIANSVIAINNTLPNEELAQFTLLGVGCDYESLVTTAAYLGGDFTFDDLSDKILSYAQCVQHLKGQSNNPMTHQALATTTNSSSNSSYNN